MCPFVSVLSWSCLFVIFLLVHLPHLLFLVTLLESYFLPYLFSLFGYSCVRFLWWFSPFRCLSVPISLTCSSVVLQPSQFPSACFFFPHCKSECSPSINPHMTEQSVKKRTQKKDPAELLRIGIFLFPSPSHRSPRN